MNSAFSQETNNKQGEICVEFPIFEKAPNGQEIRDRLTFVINNCSYFKKAIANNGIVLYVNNARLDCTVFAKSIGITNEKCDEYSKIIATTIVCKGANLTREACATGKKPPVATLQFGDLLFIIAGLPEECGMSCIFALAVKIGILSKEMVLGENA
jgi:hypothetical protein